MRVAIGADHAGFELKEHLKKTLVDDGHEVVDCGTDSTESVDYPAICAAVGRLVAGGAVDRGIVVGGSGQGEQIAANKVAGVRAAVQRPLPRPDVPPAQRRERPVDGWADRGERPGR